MTVLASRQTLTSEPVHLYWFLRRSPFTLVEAHWKQGIVRRGEMNYRVIRQASVLAYTGLIAVMAVTGCETARPDETPRLIMEQTDDTPVMPTQLEPSGPSGPSAPR